MKNTQKILLLVLLTLSTKLHAADVTATTSYEGDTFNFELSGQKNWDYDLKRVKANGQTKVQLYVKTTDQATINQIKNINNPYVQSVSITPNAIDGKYLVEFNLKSSNVETFDYLTDQPSKLILDFYAGDGSGGQDAVKDSAPAKIKPGKKVAVQKLDVDTETGKIQRTPADVDYLKITDAETDIQSSLLGKSGLFDAGDSQFRRFTMNDSDYNDESVIRSRSNYYLKFPVLETEFTFWKKMKENPPDYEIKPTRDDENKQARLLRTLFSKKRLLVFLQTYDWFIGKYPNSKYREMLAFMKGDALVQLWTDENNTVFYDRAQEAYREAIEQFPDSVLAERASLMTGLLAQDRHDYMNSVRRFNIHAQNARYKDKPSKIYAQLAMASSYSKMKRLDDAIALLNQVEKTSKDANILAEIAVRKGDVYFYSKKLPEAIATYEKAAQQYPLVGKLFPSAYFNKMEALFWNAKFRDSHKAALDFAKYFPSHDYAPYALTRVGELLDIMGADQAKAVGAYLETHFRYGNSPKTIVAKLHLLSTRMKSMKPEELDQTIGQMEELAKKSDLENIDQFKVAMLADGYARRENYKKAIDILSAFYQSNPTRADVKQVTERIVKNVGDELNRLSAKADYKELLKTYKQYSDTWLKTDRRIDTDYFLGLAYEHAGAYDAALEKYQKVADQLSKIKGTAGEKELYVNQYVPHFDNLYLRQAQSFYENAKPQEAYQLLQKIEKPLALSEGEQVERVRLASRLYEAKGDNGTAIRYLKELGQLWQGDPKLSVPVLFKLAAMQIQEKDVNSAIQTYERCKDILLQGKDSSEADLARLADSYAQVLVENKRSKEAITMLNEVIEKYDQLPFNEQRYLLGDLYFKNGETKKADVVWQKIKDNDNNVWKSLSQEKLKQAAWDVNYKKHLKRIPAMSLLEESK